MHRPSKLSVVIALCVARLAFADDVEQLSFNAAVARTLANSPSANIAREEIRRAEGLVGEVRANALPSLFGNLNYTRLDNNRVVAGTIIQPIGSFNASLTLAVPLVAPQKWAQWAHAHENVDVTRLSAESVDRDLASAAARTYLTLLAQHHLVEVVERARVSAQAHYEFAHQRFLGGIGSRVDEVRAAQELAADTAQVESVNTQLVRLRESLGVLIGADHPIDVVAGDPELPLPQSPSEAANDAAQRADLRLFRGRVTAAHHMIRDHWTDFMPSLVGNFQPFYQTPPTETVPEFGWQAQLLLSWALYDGGLRYGLERERKALEAEAKETLKNGIRQASSDVRLAEEEVTRSERALLQSQNAARLAHDGLELTTLAYKSGASTNIEVIDAERASRDADTNAALAQDSLLEAKLDLLLASGHFPKL